jgi:hypothetical protein
MWFEELTGFKEESAGNVRSNLRIEGDYFISTVDNKKFAFGALELLTLDQLKDRSKNIAYFKDRIQVSEIVADVQKLHAVPENAYALFQAASQFNLLEMAHPDIIPEQGIDRYENDRTQGPACAVACGAGTIYRNYFVPVNEQTGQTATNQVDCLDLIGTALENAKFNLWEMKNGYALFNKNGLLSLNKKLANLRTLEREKLKRKLKTGIQWNTEVTKSTTRHKVTQIYCAALPVAYSHIDASYWEPFARIILEATYESTLYAGLLNLEKNNCNLVYLTLVGGGAFGNEERWILESMQKAISKFKNTPLNVKIVSYGRTNNKLKNVLKEL